MKNLNLIFLLVSLILFSSFGKKSERISMGDNLSIEIPNDFVIQEDAFEYGKFIFAVSGIDKLFIAKLTAPDFDTMGMSEKKEIIIKNLKSFITKINGENLDYEDIKILGDLTQSSFSFEMMKPELMIGYGKIILHDSSFIFLTYITKVQPNEASLKTKDEIFNSLRMD